ncbi:glycosyltransferase family 2 protein [Clostridium perfringens]|uniref:glycosyltransferase family 2 protein n=1 Tax=Clostridium perfringens TaxID=1502 RepID=UPI0036B0DC1D
MNNEPLIYIIILNYNGYKYTLECIESLNNINYENYRIVVVDNNSTDNSIKLLKKNLKDCIILESKENLGYAGGNNLGIKYAIKNKAEYICILNNDLVVSKNFLKDLLKDLDTNKNIGMIGPMICDYTNRNKVQSTGAIINLKRGLVTRINNGKNVNEIKKEIKKCDYIGGACILLNSNLIKEIGYIPEAYFLFYEETEWCLKTKRKGYDIACDTNVKIYHRESGTISKTRGLSYYFMRRNKIVFQKRNSSKKEILYFYIYFTLKTLKNLVLRKENFYSIKCYYDGLLGKIDNKFRNVYICEE